MTDEQERPRKKSALRRALVIAGAVLGVLVLALGGLAYFAVHKRIETRGAGVVAAAAADFTLPDQTGKPVALSTLVAHGPAVLVFYRGFW